MELTHIATRSGRLSSFLKQELGLSTGLMNKLKWQDKLLVNGIPRHADFTVEIGDTITAQLDEPEPDYPPENLPITILYEDEHLLAVDKPAGMLIHPSAHRNTGTLANRVIAYYKKTGQNCAFHPITRLDRDTFGVVLLAKNAHIHGILTQFQVDKRIQKTYHALVFGCPAENCGMIDAPIARREKPSLLRHVSPDGKPSITRYEVLEKSENCATLALQPITGRTHQLRVHCQYMGFPIVGDPQYNTLESVGFSQSCGIAFQQLCAKAITLPHPITKEALTISSSYDIALKPGNIPGFYC